MGTLSDDSELSAIQTKQTKNNNKTPIKQKNKPTRQHKQSKKTNHKTKTHNKAPKTREQDSLLNVWTLERRARHAKREETGEAFWYQAATIPNSQR